MIFDLQNSVMNPNKLLVLASSLKMEHTVGQPHLPFYYLEIFNQTK